MKLYQDIHDTFKPSFLKYSLKSLIPLDIALWKTNVREKRLSFFGPKVNTFACIYQLTKFGDLMSCGSEDIFKNSGNTGQTGDSTHLC